MMTEEEQKCMQAAQDGRSARDAKKYPVKSQEIPEEIPVDLLRRN